MMMGNGERESIIIGCDHGGYSLKRILICRLEEDGYGVVDVGTDSEEIVRYPFYASQVSSEVSRGRYRKGILICSTGIGMSMIANKYPCVRASLCTSTYMGRMTRAHNDSNILCLGGKITGVDEALDIMEVWLHTEYEGGRHDISLNLIQEAEQVMFNGEIWSEKGEV